MGRKRIPTTTTTPAAYGMPCKFMTAKEAANFFRVSYWQFTRAARRQEFPRHKICGKWVYLASEIWATSFCPAIPQPNKTK